MSHFVDPTARLGADVRIWHFAVVLADAVIGDHVSIGSGAEIGRGAVIGARTRISSHVFIPSNALIGDDVFVGPGVIFTDDRYPRANNLDYRAEPPVVENGASIGAGAVILPGIRIGEGALVGAGAVVTHDVPRAQLVRGEPARLKAQQSTVRP